MWIDNKYLKFNKSYKKQKRIIFKTSQTVNGQGNVAKL